MATIQIPNGWQPRKYQRPLWDYLEGGGSRAIAFWHRRSGKDDVALNWAAREAMLRPGNYWHMLPEYAQARKAIWDAVNPHTGQRRIDQAFPPAICEKRDNDMFVRFKNGASWQVVGSDSYDRLVGATPRGVVFSEWALADPRAWAYLRPILAENGGWALFITTARGRNHAYTTLQTAQAEPSWFWQVLSAEDTGVFGTEALEAERREYERDYGTLDGKALFEQEYECSFDAAIVGSYYAADITLAEREKRIGRVPYDPSTPVHTAWDLGINDSTAIWFCQRVAQEWRLVDYLENSSVGLDWYAKQLREKPYCYGEHILPHDAEVKELGTGTSRVETLRGLGIAPRVLPATSVADGINTVRRRLPAMYFDEEKCRRGIECVRQYRREWDDTRKVFKDRPLHDWTSHAADALRYLCLGDPQPPDKGWSAPMKTRARVV